MPRKKKVAPNKSKRQKVVSSAPAYAMPAPNPMAKAALWVGLLTTLLGGVSAVMYGSSFLYKYLPFVSGLSQLSWTIIAIVGLVLTYYGTKRR